MKFIVLALSFFAFPAMSASDVTPEQMTKACVAGHKHGVGDAAFTAELERKVSQLCACQVKYAFSKNAAAAKKADWETINPYLAESEAGCAAKIK